MTYTPNNTKFLGGWLENLQIFNQNYYKYILYEIEPILNPSKFTFTFLDKYEYTVLAYFDWFGALKDLLTFKKPNG